MNERNGNGGCLVPVLLLLILWVLVQNSPKGAPAAPPSE